MAADGDEERAVRLLFSQPAPATPEGLSPGANVKCWEDAKTLMRRAPEVLKLSLREARCLRNRVYGHCGARMIAQASVAAFLERYPEQPMTTPMGEEVGRYDWRAFSNAVDGRRNARECGANHEFMTGRVTALADDLVRHGDDVMDWRNP
jgi:hypothetical protein